MYATLRRCHAPARMVRSASALLLLLLGASLPVSAQKWLVPVAPGELPLHTHGPDAAHVAALTFPTKVIAPELDVESYTVNLDLYDALAPIDPNSGVATPQYIPAEMTCALRLLADTITAVRLNASIRFRIDGCTINGRDCQYRQSGNILEIDIPLGERSQPLLNVGVSYASWRVTEGGGLNIFNGADKALNNCSYPIAFTFSEPENARLWFPCHDVPSDKALFTAVARVPAGFTVVSNGVMQGEAQDGDSAVVQRWSCPQPMPTYLFAINASVYTRYEQMYTRGDGTTVPIANYHWDTDVNSPPFRAEYAVRNMPRMFEALEPHFGTYPFDTYGNVTVHPIQFGGMEHQTMTTVSRRWLEGSFETGYAHELGHHWLGDMATCATWGDIWLNEGGATWSEALWRILLEGQSGYNAQMRARRQTYLEAGGLAQPPVWDIPLATLFNEATTYCKAAWIYHMLRNVVGHEEFTTLLQQYLETYRGKSLQTAQFVEFWRTHATAPAVPLDVFFDQWLLQQGHPILYARIAEQRNAQGMARIRLDQTQNAKGVPDVFQCLTRLQVYNAGTLMADTTFVMDQRTMMIDVPVAQNITGMVVDPENLTLQQSMIATSVNDILTTPHAGISVLPTPGSTSADIVVMVPVVAAGDGGHLSVYDATGRMVHTTTVATSCTFAAGTFVPGSYSLCFVTPTGTQYRTMMIVQ